MKQLIMLALVALLIASCAPADDTLPTLAPSVEPSPLPPTLTLTPSEVPPTQPPTATRTPRPTVSATSLPTLTLSPTATVTPTETMTLPPTVNVTVFAAASATAFVIERPVFVTLTPVPPGVVARPTSTGTPEVIADVVITESQFQEELSRLLTGVTGVINTQVKFEDGHVRVLLSARGTDAITSGSFAVYFDPSSKGFNNFITVQADSPDAFIMDDGNPASENYVNIAFQEVMPAVFEAFNTILNQRLGVGKHDLDTLVIANGTMQITLYVPKQP